MRSYVRSKNPLSEPLPLIKRDVATLPDIFRNMLAINAAADLGTPCVVIVVDKYGFFFFVFSENRHEVIKVATHDDAQRVGEGIQKMKLPLKVIKWKLP